MNVSNLSSVDRCGPVSLYGILPCLNAIGIILSIATCVIYLLSFPVVIFSRQDYVRKMNTLVLSVFGVLTGAFVLPLNLVTLSIGMESKTLKMCLATQGLQLVFEAEFCGNLALFFLVPLFILSNPLRQSFFQSTRGKIITGNIVWVVIAFLTIIPLVIVVLSAEDRTVDCCGWHLFPDPYIYGVIYGLGLPVSLVGFWSSVRMVYTAKRISAETVVPVQQQIEQSSGVRATSDKRKHTRGWWQFAAVFRFWFAFTPVLVIVMYHLSCPYCINAELTHFISNAMAVVATLMQCLSNCMCTSKEYRDIFKQLYFNCIWKKDRKEIFR